MTQELWIAILSSSVISGATVAFIAGLFNLRSKNNDYANTYYKMILERRLKAYEAVEILISHIKTAVVDKDNRPYHLLFSKDDDHLRVYKAITGGMPDALWLSDELFDATRELNLMIYQFAPDGTGLIEFGKTHYREIAELRTKIEKIRIQDITTLHQVPKFLRKKRPSDSYAAIERRPV